jgi:hypothetical protein
VTVEDDGPVRIPAPTSRQRLLVGLLWVVLAGVTLLPTYLGIARLVEESIGGGWITVVLAAVAIEAAVLGCVVALIVRRTPALEVDVARGLVRLRREEIPFADFTGARVEVQVPPARGRDRQAAPARVPADAVVLALSTSTGRACRIVLLVGDRRVQSERATAALVAAVRGSSIVAPASPDDPDGRFTRINFPGHLDADDAVDLLRAPERHRVTY